MLKSFFAAILEANTSLLNKPFENKWLIVSMLAVTIVPVLELAKWFERRGWFGVVE